MKKILLCTVLILAFAATSYAVPVRTAEKGDVAQRTLVQAQDTCILSYYNFCSGWVFYWSGYCFGTFTELTLPPQIGTVFDLSDCPLDCRHLTDVWWGCKRFTTYGDVNVEVFCASECGCPIGAPLAGVYNYNPLFTTAWQHFVFPELPLCPVCEVEGGGSGKFLVMVTDNGMGVHTSPYSDIESLNIDAGCQPDWDCVGHSFCFRSAVDYCAQYGMPGPMWVESSPGYIYGCTNVPTVPPGCHNYYGYGSGFYTEFLIDAYIACLGPTATEKSSWSDIKGMYR
jgi:hypothetical protein